MEIGLYRVGMGRAERDEEKKRKKKTHPSSYIPTQCWRRNIEWSRTSLGADVICNLTIVEARRHRARFRLFFLFLFRSPAAASISHITLLLLCIENKTTIFGGRLATPLPTAFFPPKSFRFLFFALVAKKKNEKNSFSWSWTRRGFLFQ